MKPYRSEPMGMFVMRMLWLTPTLLGPKRSDVMETAAANMNPELRPIKAVAVCNAVCCKDDTASKKKAIGVGKRAIANHPVLVKRNLLQDATFLNCVFYPNFILDVP